MQKLRDAVIVYYCLFLRSTVRISSGGLKGRKIDSRKVFRGKNGDELRPTSAKVREALFDILRNDVAGAVFLDLYAGTGAVGFEALSRGTEKAHMVESNPVRFYALNDAIDRMGLHGRAFSYREEALSFLARASSSGMSFDVIFADPPYASDEIGKILPFIDLNDVLKAGGCLVIEHPSKKILNFALRSLIMVKNYRYGDTSLTLYRKEP
jgi:16S rRNA (guanine966-N2)-methyltransferase